MTAPTSLDGPLDHLLRPNLPWRSDEQAVTECGRPAGDVQKIATRAELIARMNRIGQQRAVFTMCMTCWERVRHTTDETWDTDPVAVIRRETDRSGRRPRYAPETPAQIRGNAAYTQMANELRALAALAEAHRDEFDALMTGLAQTADLTQLRKVQRMTGRTPRR